jgi:REP element-mobilizing transposase RayT
MAGFKSAVTKRINETHKTPGQELWQSNYYERVIRDEKELHQVRQYIVDNPAKWDTDEENPNVKPAKS